MQMLGDTLVCSGSQVVQFSSKIGIVINGDCLWTSYMPGVLFKNIYISLFSCARS